MFHARTYRNRSVDNAATAFFRELDARLPSYVDGMLLSAVANVAHI